MFCNCSWAKTGFASHWTVTWETSTYHPLGLVTPRKRITCRKCQELQTTEKASTTNHWVLYGTRWSTACDPAKHRTHVKAFCRSQRLVLFERPASWFTKNLIHNSLHSELRPPLRLPQLGCVQQLSVLSYWHGSTSYFTHHYRYIFVSPLAILQNLTPINYKTWQELESS